MRSTRAAALALSLVACANRTGLTAADAGVPVGAPCVWTSFAPRAISPGDRDRVATTVRVLDDRLWVGFFRTIPDPPGSQARFVQVIDAAGEAVGAPVLVLPSPGLFSNRGPLSLWTDPVRRLHAAAAWIEGFGCQAVPLDDDARPTDERMRLHEDDCAGVVRRPDGWSYFTRDFHESAREDGVYTRFHAVGPRGEASPGQQLAPDVGTSAVARHVYDDGSFVYVWAGVPGDMNRLTLLVSDAQGHRTTPASSIALAREGSLVEVLRVVPDGDTLLLAWTELAPGATSYDVVVARTSRTGAPMGAPRVVTQRRVAVGNPPELGLAVARGVPALLWNGFPSNDGGSLHLATLDPQTLSPARTVDVATALFPSEVFLRDTSQGFLAVFTAIAPPARSQIWTAAWRCVAPR